MTDKRKGIAFQNLVAQIERAFSLQDGATVESPKFITDRHTGGKREFDIFITAKAGYHVMTTAIEVKDEKKVVGVPHVEAFNNKCDRNNVGRKVMVSSAGFAETARKLAAQTGVTLMTLSEAHSFDWVGDAVFVHVERKYEPIDVRLLFAPGDEPQGEYKVLNAAGDEVTLQNFLDAVDAAIPRESGASLPPAEVQQARVNFLEPLTAVTRSGSRHAVIEAYAEVGFWHVHHYQPYKLHSYSGDGGEFDVATTPMEVGGIAGKMMMTRSDERISLSWVPDQPLKPDQTLPALKGGIVQIRPDDDGGRE